VNDTGKTVPRQEPAGKRSSQGNPGAEGPLPLLKDLKLLQARTEKMGYEFLSYLLKMAILEAESLASGDGAPISLTRDRGGATGKRG